MWLKDFKTLVNFSTDCPKPLSGSNSREASAEINCYFAFWLPTIMHTVLKYPYFEFRFNLMNTPSFIGHFCNKVCPAMLALSWLCLPTFPARGTSSYRKSCGIYAAIGCLHSVAWSEWLVILKYRKHDNASIFVDSLSAYKFVLHLLNVHHFTQKYDFIIFAEIHGIGPDTWCWHLLTQICTNWNVCSSVGRSQHDLDLNQRTNINSKEASSPIAEVCLRGKITWSRILRDKCT